jgi:hypothetical protein
MMSSDGDREIVAACLAKGAKDYLVKPLRIAMVKGLSNHINYNSEKKKQKFSGKSEKV